MTTDVSLLSYFLNASPIVKLVMLLLLTASVISWMFIFERHSFLKKAQTEAALFEETFWSGQDLKHLSQEVHHPEGMAAVFQAGFKEYERLVHSVNVKSNTIMHSVQRAMRVAQGREFVHLESRLPFLATVSSMAPYVGLFGTVWGIMMAVRGLAQVQQASIAMVAPGIAEALIATAMGLFAAIPAGIAYNYFATTVDRLVGRFDAFQEEFLSILARQTPVPMIDEEKSA